MNITVNKAIHMALEEVVEVMGITKQKLTLIRCKTSRHYQVSFPEPVATNTRKVYVLRDDFYKYLDQLTSVATTGIDPLAPRPHAPRTTRKMMEKRITFEKRMTAEIGIIKNVRWALFGNISLRCDLLENAVIARFGCDRNGSNDELVTNRNLLNSVQLYDRMLWSEMTLLEKWKILLCISCVFNLDYDMDLKTLNDEISHALLLLLTKKNWFSKWLERRKPENAQYKLFLKNTQSKLLRN